MKKLIAVLCLLAPIASFADSHCNYALNSSIESGAGLKALRARLTSLGYTEVSLASNDYRILVTVNVAPEMEITDPIASKYFNSMVKKEAMIRIDRLNDGQSYNPNQSIDTQSENLFYKEIYRRGGAKSVFKELVEGLRNPPACS